MSEQMRATIGSKEAATYVGMSYWKLLEEAKAGRIPHIRVGSRVLFRRHSLDLWLDEREKESVASKGNVELLPTSGKIRQLR